MAGLNKEVCKNCHKKSPYTMFIEYPFEDIWEKNSTNTCESGTIFCPTFKVEIAYIYKAPPNHCPYKLEHLLRENENAK